MCIRDSINAEYMGDFLKNMAERTNEQEIYDKAVEKLIQEENDRQYQRQKEKWDKEEQARINLMYQVYDQREKAVFDKKKQFQELQENKVVEKEYVNQTVQSYEKECEEKKLLEYQRNKEHQKKILQQQQEKKQKYEQYSQMLKEEDEQQKLAWKEYSERIEAEKLKGQKILEQERNKRLF
eukprot:TRINITY_DN2455_c0_g1_i4.p2 TRINITY_DN2455_c0_g1~~TRINITY_DN2455_c0_g1_i4.p2  ORF type:complete len:181 (+),score=65.00 TRINITY_DN2455_c0_g1_i4:204-746(+)